VTAGFYPLTGNPSAFLTASALTPYLTKADNLGSLTNFATARDNLSLGTLNTPTFAGVVAQGSGSNIANLTSTALTISHTTFGQFTIQPSSGITFPDASVQTTAFPAGSDMPTGGLTGQALVKVSNSNYDADWATISSATTWGSITGTLSSQTDLQTALDGKYSTSNPAGYITSSALAGYATESWVTAGFYPLSSNPAGYLTSAPVTSVAGRTGAITLSASDISGLGSLAVVNDAPSDGSQYARKNGAWDVVAAAADFISSVSSPLSVTTGNLTIDLSAYAPLASPAFTGTPTAPTPSPGTDSTRIATTEWVKDLDYAPLNSPQFNGNPRGPTPSLSDDDTSLATTEFVKGQNYITSSALTPYLTTADAASTYYLQTNPDGFMTVAVGDSYYYPLTNPDGFITSYNADFTYLAKANNLSDLTDFSAARTNLGLGTMATASASDYSTTTVANGLYYPLSSNPAGYLTSAPVTSVAGRTGAVTIAVADVSGAAPLASPTFSGTPSLPTGTIGVTQTAGNNTTALATTAFVTAAVPAFATLTEARQFSNTTKVLSPSLAMWSMMSADIVYIQRNAFTVTNVGSVQYVAAGAISTETRLAAAAASSSRARTFGPSQVDQSHSMTVRANPYQALNFSRPTYLAGRSHTYNITDPVLTMAFYYGKAEADGVGDLTRRGIGWKVTGGSGSRFLTLQVHNGTTLTSVTSSYAVVGGTAFDWDIISDGAGNVTLYVNGASVATSSAGPTGLVNLVPVIWQEEYSTSGVPAITFHTAYHSRGRLAIINY
jgi:hypothetical protein